METTGSGASDYDFILYKIGFDNNINLELTKIFESVYLDCVYGDCDFKNLIKGKAALKETL